MKVLLLTLIQVLCMGGYSFILPNEATNTPSSGLPDIPQDFLKGLPKNLFSGLPNRFPKDLFNGLPNDLMNVIPSGLSDGPNEESSGLPKDYLNGFQNDFLKGLPNESPKDLLTRIPNGPIKDQIDGRKSNVFASVITNGDVSKHNMSCCYGGTCYDPCPFSPSMSMPYPIPVPEPVVIPARTYYEPVVHNHPPLHKIKKIIDQDKRKRHRSYESIDTYYSDVDTDSDSADLDSSVDYYDDFLPLRARRRF